MKRIFLVEDEERILQVVKLNLELEGYEVVCATDGKDALKIIDSQRFDLIILDIMLPNISGLQICENIRIKNIETPIIFTSAKGNSKERVEGLKKGADDYLVKPYSLEELLIRVSKLLARSINSNNKTITKYSFGQNHLDFKTYKAETPKGTINLTQKESLLLKLFFERENEVVSRQQILESVWGYDVYPATRTIDNFILTFRKQFEINPKSPKHFLSVRGVGYKFINS